MRKKEKETQSKIHKNPAYTERNQNNPLLLLYWQHKWFNCVSHLFPGKMNIPVLGALERLKGFRVEEEKPMNSQAISSTTSASLGIQPLTAPSPGYAHDWVSEMRFSPHLCNQCMYLPWKKKRHLRSISDFHFWSSRFLFFSYTLDSGNGYMRKKNPSV